MTADITKRGLIDTSAAARTTLPPVRSYQVPGGPLAASLAPIEVIKLSEIERGGEHDQPRGGR